MIAVEKIIFKCLPFFKSLATPKMVWKEQKCFGKEKMGMVFSQIFSSHGHHYTDLYSSHYWCFISEKFGSMQAGKHFIFGTFVADWTCSLQHINIYHKFTEHLGLNVNKLILLLLSSENERNTATVAFRLSLANT